MSKQMGRHMEGGTPAQAVYLHMGLKSSPADDTGMSNYCMAV